MNPEIEKLIDLALADGEITDKERSVILKKAEKLGEDPDEVEMILDGRLHESKKLKTKEKVGNIKVCPSCGESVKSFQLNCSGCGHEFSNVKINSSILNLISEIEKINKKEPSSPILKGQHDMELNKLKSELIENFPIPNTREDILEFLSYSLSKGKDNSYMSYFGEGFSTNGAWRKKSEEVIIKSKLIFKSDHELYTQLLQYETDLKKSLKSRNRIRNFVIGVFAIILIIIYGGIMISEIL